MAADLDQTDHSGPFDIIGDVHGCPVELEMLLSALGYTIVLDDRGRAVDATHPCSTKAASSSLTRGLSSRCMNG